jgi:hypothetical protein
MKNGRDRKSSLQLLFATLYACVTLTACTTSAPSVNPTEREMAAPTSQIILSGFGNGAVTRNPIGPQTCTAGNGAEVQVTIDSGAAGNSIDGEAKCNAGVVAGSVNAIDPGNGQQGSNTTSGIQVQGTPDCTHTYVAQGQQSRWSVVCKFF